MPVTEDLKQEHQLILKYVALLGRYCEFAENHPDSPALLEKAPDFIAFITEFADAFHHAKEEDILFKYMEAPDVLTHCNPLPVMLFEHGKGRDYLQAMRQALADGASGAFIDNALGYARLLMEHIYKEDNILYPMAENGIATADKSRLLEEYAQADARLKSRGLWQKYRTALSVLENHLAVCSGG